MRILPIAALGLCGGCGLVDGGPAFTIAGRVAQVVAPHVTGHALAAVTRITDVMAIDPETAAPKRTIAHVGADGSFELAVDAGRPYVLVFVDRTAVGAAMAVAMFRAGTLDTVSPQLAGHLALGDVAIDPGTHTATSGIPYTDLLASLGLDAAAAEYLGSVDDLSLRYANPDIDGNGIIDLEEDRTFALDFHVRANLRRGASTGPSFTVADITDAFIPADGPDVAIPVYNLTSAYVLYPASYDPTEYVAMTAPRPVLEHGAAYTATLATGAPAMANTSFSALGFGDTRGWGADYDLEHAPDLELPGSGGSPATLAYTLGATGTTLSFTNVVTRTRASLTDTGTIAIFIRLVTTTGAITSIDYQWLTRTSSTAWSPATASEIAVTIGSAGGYVSIHRAPHWNTELGIQIPAQPSGSVAWPTPLRPDEICGLAVSYDDKLGLRHFVGGVDPDPGVTCTP